MRRVVACALILLMCLCFLPTARAALEMPMGEFECAYNKNILHANGKNHSFDTAQRIVSKTTVYGEIPDGTGVLTDTMDFYKIVLAQRSHVLVISEIENSSKNMGTYILNEDGEIVLESVGVKRSDGGYIHVINGTIDSGSFYVWVTRPIYDANDKVEGLADYALYYESDKVKNDSSTDEERLSGFVNFKRVRSYEQGSFKDVPVNAWYAQNVRMAYELGLVNGVSNDLFHPTGEITIAETIALASRIHSIYHASSGEFLQNGLWYIVYVEYAIQNGIIGEREFDSYESTATREQFASILARALPKNALEVINVVNDGAIPDVPSDSQYADEVYLLYRAGILTGNDERGTFGPQTSIERSAVATIITRMAVINERKFIALSR